MVKRGLVILGVVVALAGCGDGSSSDADSLVDTVADTGSYSDTGTGAQDDCPSLFGAPSENTGLEEGKCAPSCDCEGVVFSPPIYSQDDIAALAATELLNPGDLLEADPYETPQQYIEQPDKFCGLLFDAKNTHEYRLNTYDSLDDMTTAGAVVTHYGACGMCSSLQDLAVYIGVSDLTGPVRECGLKGMSGSAQENITCLEEIGFSTLCAQIWYYNTSHTKAECLSECMAALNDPYHKEDGSPNDCILCDEEKSGPVFKAVSGRTRRNSGLPTALCRPCSTVAPLIHEYF